MTTTPGAADDALALPIRDHGLERRLRARIQDVEVRLGEAILSEASFVTEAARHLMAAGGKRFRPLLVLLAAETGDPENADTDGVLTSACVVELTHLGSLYHDDVMDEAEYRRGVPSVNARWGNLVAILSGDFLLARASEIAASLGTEVAALLARTIGR
ncbi:MAG: polyprenyl synthetase family protein, partial [Nocardioidaceae bacterium]